MAAYGPTSTAAPASCTDVPGRATHSAAARATAAGATLTVENTGAPLDPTLVATLAEPFRRGSQRLHDDHGGVGLGLAIVQRIAAAHDGTLSLASRPDGGLVVTVALPR